MNTRSDISLNVRRTLRSIRNQREELRIKRHEEICAKQREDNCKRQRLHRQRIRQIPIGRQSDGTGYPQRHSLGCMNVLCFDCGALHFIEERTSNSSHTNPKFSSCCGQGKVTLPPLDCPPQPLQYLLTSSNSEAKSFRKNIRSYNSALSFTSVGVHIDHAINRSHGPYVYRIRGELKHQIGSILPCENESPKFAQLYMYDGFQQLQGRMDNSDRLDPNILNELQNMLNHVNPYAQMYKLANERIQHGVQELQIRLTSTRSSDSRRYNVPSTNEVAAIIEGDMSNLELDRDIILEYKTGRVKRISALHPSYSALQYVLLFANGRDGWHTNIPLNGHVYNGHFIESTNPSARRGKGGSLIVTQLMFYAYMIQYRENQPWLLLAGPLLQQYIVDAFACAEQNRLFFISQNQKKLRAELYSGLQDAMTSGDHNLNELGKRVILPSTFQGSPRGMIQMYQDSMAIVAKYGKPDLFITFTCNTKWEEINNALLLGQSASDRPDLIARIFHLKLSALLDDVLKHNIFGKVIGYTHVIEYQKRGLPHAHILLILDENSKLRTIEEIDSVVSAEIPDPNLYPETYETVTKYMIHGPCGNDNHKAPCMQNNYCTKKYPRQFNNQTSVGNDGYPIYRRKNERVHIHSNGKRIDNRWIVPYNFYLATKYNAHINVEVCSSIVAVKYLHKYLYKGPDRINAVIEGNDPNATNEAKKYIDGRYISASEASWRLFSFKLHDSFPPVMRLAIHLPNEQHVVYNPNVDIEHVIEANRTSTLIEYFKKNAEDFNARSLTYLDFPSAFVWKNKKWNTRQIGFAIGRMYFVSPHAGERYFLRILLTKVKGATSFESLQTVNGIIYNSYKEACVAMGLLEFDEEWDACLREAGLIQSGKQLRELFVYILIYMEPCDCLVLWNAHKYSIIDDCKHQLQTSGIVNPSPVDVESCGLHLVNNLLLNHGKKLQDYNLPLPQSSIENSQNNRLIENQLSHNIPELLHDVEECTSTLYSDQKLTYDSIMQAYVNETGEAFFIDGPGGTGKTYVENLILKTIRSKGHIALAVASSGIAALLLEGGRTAHSTLKIPLEINSTTICNIKKKTQIHELLKMTKLILWDETPMIHKFAFEAVDRSLRDLLGKDVLFGGIIVVMSGDFRQILPVIPKGSRSDIVDSSFKNSLLWSQVKVFHLKQNMRAINEQNIYDDLGGITFSNWLLKLGNNELPTFSHEWINCPKMMLLDDQSIESLIQSIYSQISHDQVSNEYLAERAILAAKNDDVNFINEEILKLLPGRLHCYLSADTAEDYQVLEDLPIEFLNSLEISGIPSHSLNLKVGAPVMLLRNLDPSKGLCNGTRLVIRKLQMHVIEAEILMGKAVGHVAFIPRIVFQSEEGKFPFILRRKQFPLKLSYVMTINKAQGQTFQHIGLDLRVDVFTHGQLYVAFSRCKSPLNIRVLLSNNEMAENLLIRNVVYNEALF